MKDAKPLELALSLENGRVLVVDKATGCPIKNVAKEPIECVLEGGVMKVRLTLAFMQGEVAGCFMGVRPESMV